MITEKEIAEWVLTIEVSEFDGIQAKHIYSMAEIAYKKGVEDSAKNANNEQRRRIIANVEQHDNVNVMCCRCCDA